MSSYLRQQNHDVICTLNVHDGVYEPLPLHWYRANEYRRIKGSAWCDYCAAPEHRITGVYGSLFRAHARCHRCAAIIRDDVTYQDDSTLQLLPAELRREEYLRGCWIAALTDKPLSAGADWYCETFMRSPESAWGRAASALFSKVKKKSTGSAQLVLLDLE